MELYSTTLSVVAKDGQDLVVRELRRNPAVPEPDVALEPLVEYRISPEERLFGVSYEELAQRLGSGPFSVDVVV